MCPIFDVMFLTKIFGSKQDLYMPLLRFFQTRCNQHETSNYNLTYFCLSKKLSRNINSKKQMMFTSGVIKWQDYLSPSLSLNRSASVLQIDSNFSLLSCLSHAPTLYPFMWTDFILPAITWLCSFQPLPNPLHRFPRTSFSNC